MSGALMKIVQIINAAFLVSIVIAFAPLFGQNSAARCSALPSALDCDQQPDCSQFESTQQCQAGDKNCQSLKATQDAFILSQRRVCEAQNAKLREICQTTQAALEASIARCKAEGADIPAGGSLWNYNGSTVRLYANGEKRKFVYEQPRPTVMAMGVQKGTVIFEGTRNGNTYSGKAYAFNAECPPQEYLVAGPVAKDDLQVTIYGAAPRRDKDCNEILPPRNEVLVFTFLKN